MKILTETQLWNIIDALNNAIDNGGMYDYETEVECLNQIKKLLRKAQKQELKNLYQNNTVGCGIDTLNHEND